MNMSRIFVTGSADGLGKMAAQLLIDQGHQVVLHARNKARAQEGWVPTKMGGPGAPDDLDAAHRTQVWLAVGNDAAARVSGRYFYHLRPRSPHPTVSDVERQGKLLDACYGFSGVRLPA